MPEMRTDLALEASQLARDGLEEDIPGVRTTVREVSGFRVTSVEILEDGAAERLGKPRGTYVTLELERLIRRDDGAFAQGAEALAGELRALLGLRGEDSVLVAGLGNDAITPDSVGPLAVESTMVTRHLVDGEPELFGALRRVSAVVPGVLASTGVESAELVRAAAELTKPDAVIVIDALASLSLTHLCRTVQISDAGIVPGSGVGNSRSALDRGTLGVPVIAVGIPTVVDAATLAGELGGKAPEECAAMIVTPREIDEQVKTASRFIGYGVNLALHGGITVDDITMFLE